MKLKLHRKATKRELREAMLLLAAELRTDPRSQDGWWPLGDDDPEFRRGVMIEENWWRGRIERSLRLARMTEEAQR